MTIDTNPNRARRTLGLTGITINAMALTAPGALMWLLYQSQAAASFGGIDRVRQHVQDGLSQAGGVVGYAFGGNSP